MNLADGMRRLALRELRPAAWSPPRPGLCQGKLRRAKMTEEAAVTPNSCTSMEEVRAEIDRLDRILVRLMAERQAYIEAAARIKMSPDEVRLEWRIEDVVQKVLSSAEREGLSLRIAEPVWRELIDRCIEHEHEKWRSFHARNKK